MRRGAASVSEPCVGSTTRQMVVARVLLTAAVPPALPGSSVSGNSLAPPLDKLTRWLRSARRRRYAPGDGPNKAGQLAGDRGSDDIGRLAGAGELAVAGTEPKCNSSNLIRVRRETGKE